MSAVALIFAAVITVVVVRDYRRTLLVIDPPESTTSVYENSAGWAPGEDDYAEENIIPDYILLGDQSLIYFEDFVMSKSVRYCDYAEYKSKIGYVDTLDFLLNISGSDDTANIQDLLLEDIDKVFELFDMNEKSEKEEFHKMLYFMDVIQQDSESFSEEFDVNSKDPFLTMTKIFYRNLARNINSESVTLQDAYYLMRVFESDLDRHMANNNIDNLILFKDFYPGYLQIQDKFFEVISKENHVDLEEIRIGFENYSENAVYSEYMGCSLDFLTEEQKNAVIDFCSGFYRKGFPSMKSAKEHCDELVLKTE